MSVNQKATSHPNSSDSGFVIKCLECGDIIESTDLLDIILCSCGNVQLHGGTIAPRFLIASDHYEVLEGNPQE
jgi:hypothetical protein